MVPARLTLRNFLSYGDACPSLDLEEIGLACLCGDNGHGKSSLIDAITWALWGRARGRDLDALVHCGRRHMEVDFEFLVGAARYRVVRRRQRIGVRGTGRPSLEFQVWNGDSWGTLTEPTIAQTEQAIERTIHLSFETFVNSALLLQGKADLFAAAGPANRKRVLADILDLAKYDRLEAEAKEQRRRCAQVAEGYERTLGDIRARLAPAADLKDQLCAALAEQRRVDAERASRAEELQHLRSAQTSIEMQKAAIVALERQLADDEASLKLTEAEHASLAERLAADESLLAAGPAIRRGYERLEQARSVERQWAERLMEVQRLDQQIEPLAHQVAAIEARLQERIAVLSAERDEAAREAGTLPLLESRLSELERDLASANARLSEADSLAVQVAERRAELSRLEAEEANLSRLLSDAEGRIATLHAGEGSAALCPVCGGPLSPGDLSRIEAEHRESLQQTTDTLCAVRRAVAETKTTIERLSNDASAIRERWQPESLRLRDELARTSVLRDRAVAAAARAHDIVAELERLSHLSEQPAQRTRARRTLEGLMHQRAALGYDSAKHRAATRRVEQLREYDVRHQELTAATVRRDANQPIVARQMGSIDALRRRVGEARERIACLERTLAEQPDPRDRIEVVEGELIGLDRRRAELDRLIGGLDAQLQECEALQRREAEVQAALTNARREEAIYADLSVAFGRNGVQAFIVDAVLPEVEAEANRLLDLMSGGRMSIQLRTQRETRAGDLAETLDLVIADESGPRDYEMYSGGEAFRINLALRIALAKLLARRAGAPLSTLIIDEGFGSQDAAGRERMVEAVSAIRDDFRCLLVVTHIEELKQQFDTRIEVRKGERGSIAEVVRV